MHTFLFGSSDQFHTCTVSLDCASKISNDSKEVFEWLKSRLHWFSDMLGFFLCNHWLESTLMSVTMDFCGWYSISLRYDKNTYLTPTTFKSSCFATCSRCLHLSREAPYLIPSWNRNQVNSTQLNIVTKGAHNVRRHFQDRLCK